MANTGTALANGNVLTSTGFQNYTPTFLGQTDNPVATYTTAFGRFFLLGALCIAKWNVVTSTLTKTTTTDIFAVALPLLTATNASDVFNVSAKCGNATAVAMSVIGELVSNTLQVTFRLYAAAAVNSPITWAATTPGIGVLTNVITSTGQAIYEYSQV